MFGECKDIHFKFHHFIEYIEKRFHFSRRLDLKETKYGTKLGMVMLIQKMIGNHFIIICF